MPPQVAIESQGFKSKQVYLSNEHCPSQTNTIV